MKNHSWMWVLWPSFLAAAAISAAVFAFVDPLDIRFLGYFEPTSRQEIYAGGFFLFWIMAAVSSALTLQIAPRGQQVDDFGEPVQH